VIISSRISLVHFAWTVPDCAILISKVLVTVEEREHTVPGHNYNRHITLADVSATAEAFNAIDGWIMTGA